MVLNIFNEFHGMPCNLIASKAKKVGADLHTSAIHALPAEPGPQSSWMLVDFPSIQARQNCLTWDPRLEKTKHIERDSRRVFTLYSAILFAMPSMFAWMSVCLDRNHSVKHWIMVRTLVCVERFPVTIHVMLALNSNILMIPYNKICWVNRVSTCRPLSSLRLWLDWLE